MRVLKVGLRISQLATPRAHSLLVPFAGKVLRCRSLGNAVSYGSKTTLGVPAVRSFTASAVWLNPDNQGAKDVSENSDRSKSRNSSSTLVKSDTEEGKDLSKKSEKEDEKPKLTIWGKVKKEAKHYWEGTKLLGYEIRVSFKLALKLASGRELSRREDRQLKRTLQDIVRIIPFSVFVLVPFAELLLPIALKLFPNMLPSTYETASSKNKKTKKLGITRTRVGEYLRGSINDKKMIVPQFKTQEQQKEFEEFFKQIRNGEKPSRTRLLNVARMFKDDMLLDNLSRPQLYAMAKYINIAGFGTSIILRYQIRHKMRMIKRDDRIIEYEGVDSLNAVELHSACQSRGFKTIGISTGRLRDDLGNWLQLRLHDRVPSTLLILSSAYTYGGHDLESAYDAIQNVLTALPPEVYHETELELQSDQATNAQRLEVLKEQDDLIREENKEELEHGHVVRVRDNFNLDDDERTPPPTTESEADVRADEAWEIEGEKRLKKETEEKAEAKESEKALQENPSPTESEENAKADLEWHDEAEGKSGAAQSEKVLKENPSPTESEENAKADLEWHEEAEGKSGAAQSEKVLKENPSPTESEENAKADLEWHEEAEGKSGAAQSEKVLKENPSPTESEENAKADLDWHKEAENKPTK